MKKIFLKSFCARCLTLLVLALLSTNLAWGASTTVSLTQEEIKKATAQGSYGKNGTVTSSSGTWSGYMIINTKTGYLQINKNNKSYQITSPTFAGGVTSIKITTCNSTSSGRAFYICNSDNKGSLTSAPSTGCYGSGSISTQNGVATISITGSPTQFYIYANGAAYISQIEVTYETQDDNQVATPTFSPAAGAYTETQNVTLSCATEGATIRYTTDGEDVTESSTEYKSSIVVNHTMTIKAKAFKQSMTTSSLAEATYTIHNYASLEDLVAAEIATGTTVKVSFENVPIKSIYTSSDKRHGIYFDIQKGEKDIEIYYNSEEVPADWIPGGKVSGTMTCPWKNFNGTWELAPEKDSWSWNNLTYVTAVATPTISPAAGTYYEVQTVTLSTSTEGATIRYTLDGTEPTSESSEYSAQITINESCTLKAKAFKDGMDASDVASAEYVLKVTTPTLSVPADVYTSPQNVELFTSTPDAVIRYTTDDTDVTESSNVYTDAITISEETTLKAKAYKTGWEASEQIEVKYTFSTPATITLMDKGKQYGDVINTAVGANVMAALAEVVEPTGRPTMSDYEFKGWAQSKDTDNPNIIDESTVVTANMVLYAVYGKTTAGVDSWDLVTNASDLSINDKVVIVSKGAGYALSTNQANNNRTAVAITKDEENNQISWGSETTTVQELTLTEGTVTGQTTFGFYAGSGYLYAPSSSSNQLKTRDENSDGNSNWAITITDNVASIVAQGTSSRNVMQYNYNSGSPIFACYASASQTALELYKKNTTPGTTTYDFEESNKSLTVTYDANGAEGYVPTCSTLYAQGETHTLLDPENLTKEGYTFAYWTTDQAGEDTHYDAGSTYTFEEENSVTFYAQWTANKYNVAIGEVDGVVVTATYNETETISEGGNANVAYGTEVTLTVTGLAEGQDIVWNVEGATVAPEKGAPATFTVGTSAITVNATVQTVRNYELVTSNEGLVAGGEYILVSEKSENNFVANGSLSGNYLTVVAISAPVENVVSITDEEIVPFVLGGDATNGWFLNIKDGQLAANGDNMALKNYNNFGSGKWEITFDATDNYVKILGKGGSRFIQLNTSANPNRYNTYASTFTSGKKAYLYKLQKTPATSTFNVSSEGYTTFYTTNEFLMPEGAQGGIIKDKDENSVTIDYIYPAGSVVPSKTPLVIKGTKNTEFTYTITTLGSEYDGTNYLCGVPEPNFTTVAPEAGDYKFYKLTYYSSTIHTIGFYYGASNGAAFVMQNAGKAYLALPAEQAAKIGGGFGFDDEPTGINDIPSSTLNSQSSIYNLNGVRVNDMVKGNVYIINGKKYLCK